VLIAKVSHTITVAFEDVPLASTSEGGAGNIGPLRAREHESEDDSDKDDDCDDTAQRGPHIMHAKLLTYIHNFV
jgi:hypothetical protein